ncbi:hypothetical protein B0H13DRAFT_2349241 [Mycena leptocephala]|nr:hypothetical protein B0H13DRAFT_2349241 [Mycena leptocephala]
MQNDLGVPSATLPCKITRYVISRMQTGSTTPDDPPSAEGEQASSGSLEIRTRFTVTVSKRYARTLLRSPWTHLRSLRLQAMFSANWDVRKTIPRCHHVVGARSVVVKGFVALKCVRRSQYPPVAPRLFL